MNPAPNLVLVGPMGSGKTSIGRRLADRFGLRFVDADHHVEQQSGATISAIFEHVGEAGFRQREAAALAGLLAGERLLVATGGGAVLGEANRRLMRERGFVVYLQAGLVHLVGWWAVLVGVWVVLRELARLREPLYREVADLVLDTDGLSAAEAASRLGLQLAQHWTIEGVAA